MQQQLPRTLLEASVTMRWDAAAAACLGLLSALLRVSTASSGTAADSHGAEEAAERQPSELEQLLQGAFSQQQREVGARAATRILGFSGAPAALREFRRVASGCCSVAGLHPTPSDPAAATCPCLAGSTRITGTMHAAQRSPAGAWLVLLSAQMLGLAQGQNYFQQTAVSGLSFQGVPGAALCHHACSIKWWPCLNHASSKGVP